MPSSVKQYFFFSLSSSLNNSFSCCFLLFKFFSFIYLFVRTFLLFLFLFIFPSTHMLLLMGIASFESSWSGSSPILHSFFLLFLILFAWLVWCVVRSIDLIYLPSFSSHIIRGLMLCTFSAFFFFLYFTQFECSFLWFYTFLLIATYSPERRGYFVIAFSFYLLSLCILSWHWSGLIYNESPSDPPHMPTEAGFFPGQRREKKKRRRIWICIFLRMFVHSLVC